MDFWGKTTKKIIPPRRKVKMKEKEKGEGEKERAKRRLNAVQELCTDFVKIYSFHHFPAFQVF